MSHSREVRDAQRHNPKRESWVDAAFDALDGEDEELPDELRGDWPLPKTMEHQKEKQS